MGELTMLYQWIGFRDVGVGKSIGKQGKNVLNWFGFIGICSPEPILGMVQRKTVASPNLMISWWYNHQYWGYWSSQSGSRSGSPLCHILPLELL